MGTGSNNGVVKATGMVESIGSTSTFVTNAGAGGAVAEMVLVWLAAMSRYSVWSAIEVQHRGAVEHPRSEERKECASGRLACAQCAQVGETARLAAGVLHRSRTTACLTSSSDAVCVDDNGEPQWSWS